MSDPELIAAAIEASGLTLGRFARVLGLNKRTLERWRSSAVAIPAERRDWLRRWLEVSPRTRRIIVTALAPE